MIDIAIAEQNISLIHKYTKVMTSFHFLLIQLEFCRFFQILRTYSALLSLMKGVKAKWVFSIIVVPLNVVKDTMVVSMTVTALNGDMVTTESLIIAIALRGDMATMVDFIIAANLVDVVDAAIVVDGSVKLPSNPQSLSS